MNLRFFPILMAFILAITAKFAFAEDPWIDTVGPVSVGEVDANDWWEVPYILWGGDIPTFYANGGLRTTPESIFGKLGLRIKLVPGDDFVGQCRNYVQGKSAFLRGTDAMLYQASELIGRNPRTKGMCLFQMTWSKGDHFVVRSDIKNMTDLKGRDVVLQLGGPHAGLFDDALRLAQLTWDDVNVVWAKDLTGTKDSPAEIFRDNPKTAGCFVVTPDMLGLTGGLESEGSGVEGLVEGARVLFGTDTMSFSIADLYVVNKSFFDANSGDVTNFVAGYLKAVEEVLALQKEYEQRGSNDYLSLLQMAQDIWGADLVPTIEEDVHGLLLDAQFVGHPGNVAFYSPTRTGHSFGEVQDKRLDLVTTRGYASVRQGLFPTAINWSSTAFDFLTTKGAVTRGAINAEMLISEIEALEASGTLSENVIFDFEIFFDKNQDVFSAVQYGTEFQRVIDTLGVGGKVTVAVRGCADPTWTIYNLLKAGEDKGIISRQGSRGNYQYYLRGQKLTFDNIDDFIAMIENGDVDGNSDWNPRAVMQEARNLSLRRAQAVKTAILAYATAQGFTIQNPDQIQPLGIGIREPAVVKPANDVEAGQNRRVIFSILSIKAEAPREFGYDY